ncbi:hypothetical protein BS17DRAFT_763603 [Gyrodon lividus]|nr:hypothetical protein BS17DRAFT_763603 [Gyrodon lividus]
MAVGGQQALQEEQLGKDGILSRVVLNRNVLDNRGEERRFRGNDGEERREKLSLSVLKTCIEYSESSITIIYIMHEHLALPLPLSTANPSASSSCPCCTLWAPMLPFMLTEISQGINKVNHETAVEHIVEHSYDAIVEYPETGDSPDIAIMHLQLLPRRWTWWTQWHHLLIAQKYKHLVGDFGIACFNCCRTWHTHS